MAKSDLRTTPQQGRSAETIRSILDAAEEVFADKGVDNATTSDIAEAAHISVGRVYYWFSSKDSIIEALGDRSAELLESFYGSVMTTREQHARFSSTERILRGIVELARANPSVALVLDGRSRGMAHNQARIRASIVGGSARVYAAQFPGTSEAEARLVAETTYSLASGAIVQLIEEDGDDLLREIVYATSAYLSCRFPPDDADISDFVASARPGTYPGTMGDGPVRPVTYPESDTSS